MLFSLSRHSSASQQRRRNTEPLNPLSDRCKQLSWNRYLSQLECYVLYVFYVLGVADNLRPDLDQSRRAGIPEVVRQRE